MQKKSSEYIYNKIVELKKQAGSHSPSINNIRKTIPELTLNVDACFLSNPYATDLFMKYFNEEIVETGKLRDILEFYPSQMSVISEKLSKTIDVDSKNIFIGNGAIEIIQAILQNFVKRKILINIPTFSSYYEFLREDVEVVYNKLSAKDNFNISIDSLVKISKEEDIDSLVLINPNNPDGAYVSQEKVLILLEKLKHLETIIIDESFIHFAYENEKMKQLSFVKMLAAYPNLIVVKSMSKDFGVAGLRAGYAVMSESRINYLKSNGFLWNVNGLAEYFFDLYTRKDFLKEYEKVRLKYINETKDFYEELGRVKGIKTYTTRANFVLIELLNEMTSDEFVFKMLAKYGVYTRTCSDKIGLGDKFIRVASRGKIENKIIIQAINKMLLENE